MCNKLTSVSEPLEYTKINIWKKAVQKFQILGISGSRSQILTPKFVTVNNVPPAYSLHKQSTTCSVQTGLAGAHPFCPVLPPRAGATVKFPEQATPR